MLHDEGSCCSAERGAFGRVAACGVRNRYECFQGDPDPPHRNGIWIRIPIDAYRRLAPARGADDIARAYELWLELPASVALWTPGTNGTGVPTACKRDQHYRHDSEHTWGFEVPLSRHAERRSKARSKRSPTRRLDYPPFGRFRSRRMTPFRDGPLLLVLAACLSCGGASSTSEGTPDERADLAGIQETRETGEPTRPVGREIFASRWLWVGAACTEGDLDLRSIEFGAEMRVYPTQEVIAPAPVAADAPDGGTTDGGLPVVTAPPQTRGGLLIITDQSFKAGEARCMRTIVQRAMPPAAGDEDWRITEETRISAPSSADCEGVRELSRPGSVHMRGQRLEVLVQRSNSCNNLEVRNSYEALPLAPLADDQVIRRFFAHFNRRDVEAVVNLFDEGGSMLDPAHISESGGPARLEGRDAVRTWMNETIAGVPWVALRLESLAPAGQPGQHTAAWSYMDPRRESPLAGSSKFTLAAGAIFEMQLEYEPTGTLETPRRPGETAPGARPAAGQPGAGTAPAVRPTGPGTRPARPRRPAPPPRP